MKLKEIRFELTRNCNLNCGYCYNKNRESTVKGISSEDRKRLIKSALPLGLERVSITGGEPLLEYGKLLELIEYCSGTGVETILCTNATLVNEGKAVELAEAGVGRARVSLDGGSSGVNARTRGPSFKKTVEGIKCFKDAGVGITLRPTVSKKNCRDLKALLELAVKLGVDRIDIQRYLLQRNPEMNERYALSLNEYKEALSELLKLKDEYGGCMDFILYSNWYEFTQPGFRGEVYKTENAFDYFHVDVCGDLAVGACDGNKLANVRDRGFVLRDFWLNNSVIERIREHKPHGICGRCRHHSMCYPTMSPTSNLIGCYECAPIDCPIVVGWIGNG